MEVTFMNLSRNIALALLFAFAGAQVNAMELSHKAAAEFDPIGSVESFRQEPEVLSLIEKAKQAPGQIFKLSKEFCTLHPYWAGAYVTGTVIATGIVVYIVKNGVHYKIWNAGKAAGKAVVKKAKDNPKVAIGGAVATVVLGYFAHKYWGQTGLAVTNAASTISPYLTIPQPVKNAFNSAKTYFSDLGWKKPALGAAGVTVGGAIAYKLSDLLQHGSKNQQKQLKPAQQQEAANLQAAQAVAKQELIATLKAELNGSAVAGSALNVASLNFANQPNIVALVKSFEAKLQELKNVAQPTGAKAIRLKNEMLAIIAQVK